VSEEAPGPGAATIVLVPSILRWAQVPSGSIGFVRAMPYGLILLLLVFLRPEGLPSERRSAFGPRADRRG